MKSFKDIQRILREAATPGKPETMAQRHTRMYGFATEDSASFSQKRMLAFAREIAKDWKSGDMALNRMESIMRMEYSWLIGGVNDDGSPEAKQAAALSKAFRKQVKAAGLEPTSRLGKGGGFNPSMGKITPNQIGRFFDLVVDFVQNDWLAIAPDLE